MASASRIEGVAGGSGRSSRNGGGVFSGRTSGMTKKAIEKIKNKDVSKVGSKVKLNPNTDSMKVVPTKSDAKYGLANAKADAFKNAQIAKKRAAMESATSSKRGLKAANKTPKRTPAQIEAQRLSNERAKRAAAEAKIAAKSGKPTKDLTQEQKFANRKRLDYDSTGKLTKESKKSQKTMKSLGKLYDSGFFK
jgi:hypothetical protein